MSVLIGPDNGLLAPAVGLVGGATRAVELTNHDYQLAAPGPTFAGRDVFAPAAAHLCQGVDLSELGPSIDPAGLLPGVLPLSHLDDDGALVAEVLWVDRYGNAQLNVDPDEVDAFGDRLRLRVDDGSRTVRRAASYTEIGAGEIGLVVDSYGLLSVVLDRRSAATELGLRAGMAVRLEAFDDTQEGAAPAGVVTSVEIGRRPDAPEEAREEGHDHHAGPPAPRHPGRRLPAAVHPRPLGRPPALGASRGPLGPRAPPSCSCSSSPARSARRQLDVARRSRVKRRPLITRRPRATPR